MLAGSSDYGEDGNASDEWENVGQVKGIGEFAFQWQQRHKKIMTRKA